MADVRYLADLYAQYAHIKFAFLWTLQAGAGNGDLPQRLNGIMDDLTQFTLHTEFADPTSPPDPPTPPEDPMRTITVVKIPQSANVEQARKLAVWHYGARNTMTYSTDDMQTLMDSAEASPESKIIAYGWKFHSEGERAIINQYPREWRPMPGPFDAPIPDPPTPSDPLDGFRLGHLFAYRYALTSPFNAPRTYGNKLHEGADYDLVGGAADNKTDVLCAYAGIVDRSLDSTGGYGKYVRVKHNYNGLVLFTWYCHLDARHVTTGQSLKAGDRVGEVGTTGNVTGEHVHFNLEVPGLGLDGYVVADVVDPEPYMAAGRLVLPLVGAPLPPAIDLYRFKVADPDCWRVVRMPDGRQEDVQDMDLGGGMFVRRKGSNGEWHRHNGHFFWLIHDTSPDVGKEGIERVYTLYKNGQPGAPKSKVFQAVGELWKEDGVHHVQFRAKADCRKLDENSGAASNSSIITRHEKNYTFNRYGQNLTFDEVIFERTGVETQIYGRKDGKSCGWIGWEAPWGSSEPVEIHWNRGRLTVEPKRWCNWE
jgi:murein DD-endopeptidase MepM/ murein hydrolase activator NlpD